MDGMIKLYSAFRDTLEKKAMGFMMSAWDEKLLKYGAQFEAKMMDLSVNIPLEKALDLGWEILADCFNPEDTGLRTELISKFWPKKD
jgi:V/A-type H+-transporting ATPase subunit B